MPTMLESALALAARGFRVIPLYDPGPNGKRPRFNNWTALATTDPAMVTTWWRAMPNANVRADGGQVVLPPSVHESGGVYKWAIPQYPIAPLPDWLYALIERDPAPTT